MALKMAFAQGFYEALHAVMAAQARTSGDPYSRHL